MVATSDALIVGEEFISEHFFTTEARSQSFQAKVLDRRKEWDAQKSEGHATTRTRYTEARRQLAQRFVGLAENADTDALDHLYALLREVLGYNNALLWETERFGGSETDDGPAIQLRSRDLSGDAPFVIIEARSDLELEDILSKNEKTLLRDFHSDSEVITSAAGLLSHLFVSTENPKFALVLAGSKLLITERERWLEGRYLVVDLQVVGERADDRRGGEVDRALACVTAEALAPDPEGNIWWAQVIDESVKHTVGVSKDLREGVRLSIELIANDVVDRRREQGLAPLSDDQAQVLAGQSLRFLYRILFLLYAEATPELSVVPAGDPTYGRGYSLDRLRELLPVELVTPRAKTGTHFYDSLSVLFELVERGHDGRVANGDDALSEGLTFRSLRADLFLPAATSLIDEAKLSNEALQQVLRHLLLSKEAKGKDRGFISYAELGINQLGAVYEGLMSYTGFFAHDTLYEVAKNGNAEKGSWVVPADRVEGIAEADFVRQTDEATGELKPVVHSPGTFVFRLAGRERQQSASYYTPEVLTRFTVSQALEELLDKDEVTTTAEEILDLTVCEPALGSGAFAIEAVRQLAEQYLKRRQIELDERIDPDAYPAELQRVKAYLALHQVYGVDLNATAVEFAEITLWLDTMTRDLQAPWFGLHLRRGNSLIGARRAVVPGRQLTDKGWIDATLVDVPLVDSFEGHSGAVHHFLLPAGGWGATVGAKEAKELAPDTTTELKTWRRGLKKKLTAGQVKQLRNLAARTEVLWQLALRRLKIAESEIRRDIPVWGRHFEPTGGAVTREQIEASLADEGGAYRRLRRVMDAWCALWFWPLTEVDRTVNDEIVDPPSVQEWIDTLIALLGTPPRDGKFEKHGQTSMFDVSDWDQLGEAEEADLLFAQAKPIEHAKREHPWLVVAERVATRQSFFHWELDFAPVFFRGGFDLQVGNPPWVRPRSDVDALLAEGDPWFQLAVKPTQSAVKTKRAATLTLPGVEDLVLGGTADVAATSAFVGNSHLSPVLAGLQPDLYRSFMLTTWRHAKPTGSVGLIHLESHFTDEKAGGLRAETYCRLRRHWQFINELKLFEIQNQRRYGVNVYGGARNPQFLQAASLYHPDTVIRSLEHDGSGAEPGIKDLDGNWDVRPHASRIVTVTPETLKSWHAVLETDDVPVAETRMVYAVNKSTATVLDKLARAPRIGTLGLKFSRGWDESIDRHKGFFDSEWGVPESWDSVILQGSHLSVGRPLYKYPNESMLHNTDWTEVDLETLAPDEIPVTSYKPRGDRSRYDGAYTHWKTEPGGSSTPARAHYRLAWRNMAANTGERTFIPAIIPPGAAHIHGVSSVGLPESEATLTVVAGYATSLLHDFAVRVAPKSTISASTLDRLPFIDDDVLRPMILLRSMRLNCVTSAYSTLWQACFDPHFANDGWTTGGLHYEGRPELGAVTSEWTPESPLRRPAARRQAMLELDVLVAIALKIEADELCTIYRTQFPVLYGYDRRTQHYDSAGQLVPSGVIAQWRRQPAAMQRKPGAFAHPGSAKDSALVGPFEPLDREADMRLAFRDLQERVAIRRSNSA